MKSKGKLILTILVISLIGVTFYYFINPFISLTKGKNIPLSDIVNKYFIDDSSTYYILFNDNLTGYISNNEKGNTFTFTFKDGYIKSDNYNFLILNNNTLWNIEGRRYFYEINE